MMRRDVMRIAAVVVTGLVGASLVGAASVAAFESYETTRVDLIPPPPYLPWGDDVWDEELAAFLDEHGWYPADEPYSARELEDAYAIEAESRAKVLTAFHPEVVTPAVTLVARDDAAALQQCLGEDTPLNGWGGLDRFSDDAGRAVAEYICLTQYPPYPHVRATDRQITWSYAYNTRYVVPCLEAHGVPQTPAPPLADYIDGYYRGLWFPQYPVDGPAFVDAFGENLCPDFTE